MRLSRILLPAVALWLGALALELLASSGEFNIREFSQFALVLSAAVLLLAVIVAWRRPTLRSSPVLAVFATAAMGTAAAAIHLLPMVAEPLNSLASSHSEVVLTGIVESEGRLVVSSKSRLWQLEPEYQFLFASSTLSSGQQSWEMALPFQVASAQTPPAIGTQVRLRGPLAPGKLPATAAFIRVRGDIAVLSTPGFVDQIANDLRTGLRAAVANRPPDAAALVAGLTIGAQGEQSSELTQAMRTAGLSHLTAVSGGNVAVIIVLVFGLARWCRLRLGGQVICCLLALAWFVVLVRPQPSVLRAAVMGAVVLIGLLTGGQRRGTGVLAVSIALLIAIAPELAVSWGFALSVAATGGLILWSPLVLLWLRRHLSSWPLPLLEGLGVTLSAQLATTPIIIAMGSTVGLAGIPANLLAMPVVPVITVLGLITAALGTLLPGIAVLTGLIASWFASWIATVAFAMSSSPLAVVPWPSGVNGALLAIALLGLLLCARSFLLAHFPHGTPLKLRLGLVAFGLTLVLLVPWLAAPRGWPMSDWIFVACDVGQGDALVIRSGPSSAMLVDAGLDGRDVDQCLSRLQVSTLDVIVLTHFHADHVGGLSDAMHGRAVGAVFATSTKEPAGEAAHIQQELAARGLEMHTVRTGERHQLAELSWQVLWPSRFIDAGSIPNNASVVLLIEVEGLRILLPGDIEPEAQSALMSEHPAIQADIAKIPHHGSRFQEAGFAQWAGGRLAVVSVGVGNDYGHPSASTIQQWQQAGAEVWRTDLQGSIAVSRQSDGSLGVVAFKA
ncbi:MAG: DNA internalization-related competence protein ComEC/Rec2 [Actinomycetota bacterium]|nr:DNA internalization-related competence protein ComEC/Rec2 [Actinomycetota bacterium]